MSKQVVGKTTAFLVNAGDSTRQVVIVPVLFDQGIPDLPKTILLGDHVAVLKGTAPITYQDYGVPYVVTVESEG